MKRIERNTYNALRKSVTAETINVEIPVDYTHEGRQGIHEMLTIEKHMRASMICWNSIINGYVIHYVPTVDEYTEAQRREQESQDIDEIMDTLPKSDRTWNGYEKPAETTETEETAANAEEQTAETTNTTDTEEEEEEQNMKPEYKHIYVEEARRQLEARQDRSAWDRAVTEDAIDLLDTVNDRCEQVTRQFAETEEGSAAHVNDLFVSRVSLMDIMKNGAESWHDYSWGGCGLIYDGDIAEHYCTPSELKKVHGGERRPNSREKWLDVQARALRQAAGRAADALIAASLKTYTVKGA